MPAKRGATAKPKNPGLIQDDDLVLWESVAQSINPLSGRKLKSKLEALAKGAQPKASKSPAVAVPARQITASKAPDMAHGKAPGLDRRTQLRLRRGKVEVEARLDLHGMTQEAAHDALFGFLQRTQARGYKTVLVVTGKGTRADGRIGVLRQQVPRWLNEPRFRALVHAFDYAAPPDGGEGALYILLRRRK
jgi:DNA-nicking Smr family endonuclease